MGRKLLYVALIAACSSVVGAAVTVGWMMRGDAASSADRPGDPAPIDEMVIAANQVMIDGRPLKYTSRTGLIPIYEDQTGALMARMFIIAYTVDRTPGEPPRPLTFLWNGGPGANSAQSHLLGFGPRGFDLPPTFPEWTGPPDTISDRPETWLAVSDLVFVDPIGTGYSRAVDYDARNVLYTRHGDAEAVAEMIRVYRTRYDAFDQPLFIGGESYGTTRAMEVAWALARRRTPLAGVILISGGYDAGQEVPGALRQALQVPMYTATAHFHERLPADLQNLSRDEAVQRATDWAQNEYASMLEQRDSLTAVQRAALLEKIEHYSGVDRQFVDPETLTLGKDVVMDRLLDDVNRELGHYDSRLTAPRRDLELIWLPTRDPSILPMMDIMQGTSPALIRYIRDTLGYQSDLLYKGPFGEGFHPETLHYLAGEVADDWMTLLWDRPRTNPPDVPPGAVPAAGDDPPLEKAMRLQPGMRVFNVKGLYDGSCAAQDEAVARTDRELRARVRNGCYAAGHAAYTDAAVRRELLGDFKAFVEAATAEGR